MTPRDVIRSKPDQVKRLIYIHASNNRLPLEEFVFRMDEIAEASLQWWEAHWPNVAMELSANGGVEGITRRPGESDELLVARAVTKRLKDGGGAAAAILRAEEGFVN